MAQGLKIAFLDTKTMGEVPNLGLFTQFGEVSFFEITKAEETLSRSVDADVVITCKVVFDKAIMQQLPKLKLICIAATGTNNVDLEFAALAGIKVKNVAGYSTHSVAQATIAMVLALQNHISYYDHFVKSGTYTVSNMFTHIGRPIHELYGKNYGIIGLGAIGLQVAKIAEAFGCNVCYYSTSGKNKNSKFKQLSLEELLEISDIVSIHSPLNDQTRNLIHLAKLKCMKPTAILLNMARGGIVNEKDLAIALNEEIIAGAGSDVFSKEPAEEHNPLLHVKNPEKIILAPHCAWASLEARSLLIEKIGENIATFIKESR